MMNLMKHAETQNPMPKKPCPKLKSPEALNPKAKLYGPSKLQKPRLQNSKFLNPQP